MKFVDIREVDDVVRDGDLVVLDAGQGLLRLLGHDPLACTFHAALHLYADACQSPLAHAPKKCLESVAGGFTAGTSSNGSFRASPIRAWPAMGSRNC